MPIAFENTSTSPEALYSASISGIKTVLNDHRQSLSRQYARIFNMLLFKRVDHLRKIILKTTSNPPTIQKGPFAGMLFHTHAAEGCYIPKLLGCYEAELQPALTLLSAIPYKRIINVGCAEGYYAVGLARLFPSSNILAFDINPKAQALCRQLAIMNNVAHRIHIDGELQTEQWATLLEGRALVICDIEGAEYELLKPVGIFRHTDLLIELHQTQQKPKQINAFLEEFSATHHIQIIQHGGRNPNQFEVLKPMRHLDQWLCVWEFRDGPTPWALLRAKIQ